MSGSAITPRRHELLTVIGDAADPVSREEIADEVALSESSVTTYLYNGLSEFVVSVPDYDGYEGPGRPPVRYELSERGEIAVETGDDPGPSDGEKPTDEVYRDRNLLACALVASNPGMGGWTPAEDADPDEWALVWIETPMGQCSWHVPRDMAESLLGASGQMEYDGHSRETKNDRLASWTQEGAWR